MIFDVFKVDFCFKWEEVKLEQIPLSMTKCTGLKFINNCYPIAKYSFAVKTGILE